MFCPYCRKLVKIDPYSNVDIRRLKFREDGLVTGIAVIIDPCRRCRLELRRAMFSFSLKFRDPRSHDCPDKDIGMGWLTEVMSAERYERKSDPNATRYITYIGVELSIRIKCPCGEYSEIQSFGDEIQASFMTKL